ncbi:hypothetical protein MLD38_025480 [Melastoma candidum]|uniref:Uncharacterized protein n=1 Tax=Melastoma candidum TaxID=119954 RepID=A0ACB9P2F8_9MYRT|nr:hypothetical protein MLD38_025480 [Melastoma candidum]
MEFFMSLVLGLGVVVMLKNLSDLLLWFHASFIRSPKDLKAIYGSWALVTGCTTGIGKAFALGLAREGLDLVLVARYPEKLVALRSEILRESPNTKLKPVVVDFSEDDGGVCGHGAKAIEDAVGGLEVGIVINNAGLTYPRAMYFHEVDEGCWRKIVRVNVEGVCTVTRAVVKGMVKRGRGAIVNIGSGAAVVVPSHPLFSIYAATKAFVDQFSRSLHVEYKNFGIDVQCQVPLYVATGMASRVAAIENASFFVPSPEEYAAAAISRIGYEPRCTPYWPHSLQWCVAWLLPDWVLDVWRLSIGLRRRCKSMT